MCYTNTESLVRPIVNQAIDQLEIKMRELLLPGKFWLEHDFGDHLYVRKIIMPAGSKVTSKIHKYRHPYFILFGKVKVWKDDGKGWEIIEAPFDGMTEPGTRRVLDVLEDTVWITVHYNPTNTTDLGELEEWIIEPHTNHLLENEARVHE
jgi:hypothetical protein